MASPSAASVLKALHKPSDPLVLPNIYDIPSLEALLALNTPQSSPVKAVATASYAIAATLGIKDEDLTLEQNLARLAELAPLAHAAGLPVSVDLQDGYGPRIREAVSRAAALGASGGNIEDFIPGASYTDGVDKALYPLDVQVARLKEVFEAAPDFVLNARCDVFKLEPPPADDDEETLKEAVARGRAYLEAGATTVFYWGGARGLRTSEVERLVGELGGRVAVKLRPVEGEMSVAELARVGVARISVGPSLYLMGRELLKDGAKRILEGGHLLA